MKILSDIYQTADWKKEKHIPAIEAPEKLKKGETTLVKVEVGKEIAHPNKTEHHIRWIELLFLPSGEKFAYQIGRSEFTAHGESANGPDTSTIYSAPKAVFAFKTDKPGKLISHSYCNIHGLWKDEKEIKVE